MTTTAGKSPTPHAPTLVATPLGSGYYGATWRVTATRLDGTGDLLLFRGVNRAGLTRYATRHGYTIEWRDSN